MELLVATGIVAVLLALLVPTLRGSVETARSFKCQMTLRGVALDFSVYGDEQLRGWRGRDEELYGDRFFSLQTFIDSQYGVAEFWRHGDAEMVTLRPGDPEDPPRCPLVEAPLTLMNTGKGVFNTSDAWTIQSRKAVSYGFNARLHRVESMNPNSSVGSVLIVMSSEVLSEPLVPLAMDVDAGLAEAREQNPILIAPSLMELGPYRDDRLWHPGMRHRGGMNVAMTSGEVLSVRRSIDETNWRWDYHPITLSK